MYGGEGDDQASTIRTATGAQGRPGARCHVASIAEQGDPLDRWRRLAEESIELLAEPVEGVAIG